MPPYLHDAPISSCPHIPMSPCFPNISLISSLPTSQLPSHLPQMLYPQFPKLSAQQLASQDSREARDESLDKALIWGWWSWGQKGWGVLGAGIWELWAQCHGDPSTQCSSSDPWLPPVPWGWERGWLHARSVCANGACQTQGHLGVVGGTVGG